MLFQTIIFLFLFLATLAFFYTLPKRFRLSVLATSSLIFYIVGGLIDFALLLSTLIISYYLSKKIRPYGPKWPIAVCIALLLTSLGYFKYANFVYQNANTVLLDFTNTTIPTFGGSIIPLGISFYTFQIIAYLVDLYKGKGERSQNFLSYLVFIMFFGQLIAGPIMRSSEYIKQLVNLKRPKAKDIEIGLIFIVSGLVKKVAIADSLAPLIDSRFANAHSISQADAWIASYLFSFQIFFDFSGYVNIALGLGKLLGINLRENFKTPYLSQGPSEFWSRWHITLSQWFRDYLYIPLGGNRHGRTREIVNVLLVMIIAGIWHGAGWQFAIWGIIHGFYLVISRFISYRLMYRIIPLPLTTKYWLIRIISIAIFFHLTVLAWIPFRSPNLSTTLNMVSSAFRFDSLTSWTDQLDILLLVLGLFCLHVLERIITEHIPLRLRDQLSIPKIGLILLSALSILIILYSSGTSQAEFIYFRF